MVCVRVVLPSDDLVRFDCVEDTTVADLLGCVIQYNQQQSKEMKRCECRCGAAASEVVHRNVFLHVTSEEVQSSVLELVRLGVALETTAIVADVVQPMDLLEFHASAAAMVYSPSSSAESEQRDEIDCTQYRIPLMRLTGAATTIAAAQHANRTTQSLFRSQRSEVVKSQQHVTNIVKHHKQKRPLRRKARYVLLRAAMECLEQLEAAHSHVHRLLVRCAAECSSPSPKSLPMTELLTSLHQIHQLLKMHLEQEDTHQYSVSDPLYVLPLLRPLSAAGRCVLMEGWVVLANWGVYWWHQRREYACLCEDGVLLFFPSEQHCHAYISTTVDCRFSSDEGIVSLKQQQNNHNSMTPTGQIDLVTTKWVVRKAFTTERNAFAFFDPLGKLRLIVEVSSRTEADQWLTALWREITLNEFYLRMDANNTSQSNFGRKEALPVDPDLRATSFEIPLRWLYARIDRLDTNARQKRLQCETLNQAVKDLRRDRLCINGELFAGASVEQIILALTRDILKRTTFKAKSTKSFSVNTDAREIQALCFARQLLICSSRTHGGGDILDTLHLLVKREHLSVCPDAQAIDPIEISLFSKNNHQDMRSKAEPAVMAQIRMRMIYRLVQVEEAGSPERHGKSLMGKEESTVSKVVAIYSRKLRLGEAKEAHDVDGSVRVEIL